MSNYEFRPANKKCPECSARLEASAGPDYVSHYRCTACGWFETYDTYERPDELERWEK